MTMHFQANAALTKKFDKDLPDYCQELNFRWMIVQVGWGSGIISEILYTTVNRLSNN
jgi:hypothetical protein